MLAIALSYPELFAANTSIFTAYKSFQPNKAVNVDNIEEVIHNTQFFKKFVAEKGEKFLRSKIAIPTNTKIPVLLEVQNDKIATAAKKIYAQLMATPVTSDTLNKVKKDLHVIQTLQDQYGLQKASEMLNTQDIMQELQPKMVAIETTEQLEALKKADKTFADSIIKVKRDNLTGQMLINAKKALTDFKTLSSQLNDQARIQAQAFFGTPLDSYIKGMESAYEKRMETIPDALSLVLKE